MKEKVTSYILPSLCKSHERAKLRRIDRSYIDLKTEERPESNPQIRRRDDQAI